jgi:hypothetical protein
VLWPLVLTLAGLAALFLPLQLGMADPPDLISLALLYAGAVWGFWGWHRKRGRGRLALAIAQGLLALLPTYWVYLFAEYEEVPQAVPRVGDKAPDIRAERVRDGATFTLQAQRGKNVLLVFFRGHW